MLVERKRQHTQRSNSPITLARSHLFLCRKKERARATQGQIGGCRMRQGSFLFLFPVFFKRFIFAALSFHPSTIAFFRLTLARQQVKITVGEYCPRIFPEGSKTRKGSYESCCRNRPKAQQRMGLRCRERERERRERIHAHGGRERGWRTQSAARVMYRHVYVIVPICRVYAGESERPMGENLVARGAYRG